MYKRKKGKYQGKPRRYIWKREEGLPVQAPRPRKNLFKPLEVLSIPTINTHYTLVHVVDAHDLIPPVMEKFFAVEQCMRPQLAVLGFSTVHTLGVERVSSLFIKILAVIPWI